MRYLDPKNDLTFKKIFGNHPQLVMSLLNSLLPLKSPIVSVEYLSPEQVPQIPAMKNSIVDVRCVDQNKRTFAVGINLFWIAKFKYTMVFHPSKTYIKQFKKEGVFTGSEPFYALSLVNEVFEPQSNHFYHHYSLVHSYETDKKLEGLEFVFVELPKFKANTIEEKKMMVLWLRFLTEVDENSREIPEELKGNEIIREALSILEESSFTKGEIEDYDRYWDWVQSERTLISEAEKTGEERGKIEEKIKGKIEGIIKFLRRGKLTIEEIAEDFDVTIEFVTEIGKKSQI